LKLALEFVENVHLGEWQGSTERQEEIVTAINKALAQPAQEPVAHLCKPDKHGLFELPTTHKACKDCFPVYTAPPQRPWVGLTDDDIFAAVRHLYGAAGSAFISRIDDIATARAIEAALRSKNT